MDEIDGEHSDFIKYIFNIEPQAVNSIKLELDPPFKNKNIELHIFEQLLQIFVDGLKFKYSTNGTVDINNLTKNDLNKMKLYFKSFGFIININILDKYIHKNNPFIDKNLIKQNTKLNEFFYDLNRNNLIYRISFDFII